MNDLCLVKVLHYESQEPLKKKKILECCDCPLRSTCPRYEKQSDREEK